MRGHHGGAIGAALIGAAAPWIVALPAQGEIVEVYFVADATVISVGESTTVRAFINLIEDPDYFSVTGWGGDLIPEPLVISVGDYAISPNWTPVPSPDGDDLAGFNALGFGSPANGVELFSFTVTGLVEGLAYLRFEQTPNDNSELFYGVNCGTSGDATPLMIRVVVPSVGTLGVFSAAFPWFGRRRR